MVSEIGFENGRVLGVGGGEGGADRAVLFCSRNPGVGKPYPW